MFIHRLREGADHAQPIIQCLAILASGLVVQWNIKSLVKIQYALQMTRCNCVLFLASDASLTIN